MRVRQPYTLMGLNITPCKTNAKKLAHDLAQLQAKLYRQIGKEDFLDQDPSEGHLNFELNKFGIALQETIKNDLRAHPEKPLVEFYVNLLAVCWAEKNFELAARVYCGINNATSLDEVDVEPDVYEVPPEDPIVKETRSTLKVMLEQVKEWGALSNLAFPTPVKAKELYGKLLNEDAKFIPSIQALMNYIAIRLDNAGSLYLDDKITDAAKLKRLFEMKDEILKELFFIEGLLGRCLPRQAKLNFVKLETIFGKSLTMILQPPKLSSSDLLDEKLKISKLKSSMPQYANESKTAEPVKQRKVFRKSPRGDAGSRIMKRDTVKRKSMGDIFSGSVETKKDDSQNDNTSDGSKLKSPGSK